MFYFSAYYYREIDEAMESRAAAVKARKMAAARAKKTRPLSPNSIPQPSDPELAKSDDSLELNKAANNTDFISRVYFSLRNKWLDFLFKFKFKPEKGAAIPPVEQPKKTVLVNENFRNCDDSDPNSSELIQTVAEIHTDLSTSPHQARKNKAGRMSTFKSISLLELKEMKKAAKIADAKKSKSSFLKSAEQLDVHSVLELWQDTDRSFESCGSLSSDSSGSSLSE